MRPLFNKIFLWYYTKDTKIFFLNNHRRQTDKLNLKSKYFNLNSPNRSKLALRSMLQLANIQKSIPVYNLKKIVLKTNKQNRVGKASKRPESWLMTFKINTLPFYFVSCPKGIRDSLFPFKHIHNFPIGFCLKIIR